MSGYDLSDRAEAVEPDPAGLIKSEGAGQGNNEVPADLIKGDDLLDRAMKFLERFVKLPSEDAYVAAILWAAHTHMMDAWDTTPRLAFLSAEPGSGKSRAMEIVALLVVRALEAANATTASIIRAMDDVEGVPNFFIDEIDTKYGPKAKGDEELRGLLNAGNRRGGTFLRCEMQNEQWVPVRKNAFAAVAMAGIGNLPDTILTRSIVVKMRKRARDEKVEPYRQRDHMQVGHALRDELAAWADQVREEAARQRPALPDEVEDRDADVWEPLIVVADLAGGAWPVRARNAAQSYVKAIRAGVPQGLGAQLLADLRACFSEENQLSSADVVRRLLALEEAPWGNLNGRKIDQCKLGEMLKEFEISSTTIRFSADLTLKGYRKDMFHDAWGRYLPNLAGP